MVKDFTLSLESDLLIGGTYLYEEGEGPSCSLIDEAATPGYASFAEGFTSINK